MEDVAVVHRLDGAGEGVANLQPVLGREGAVGGDVFIEGGRVHRLDDDIGARRFRAGVGGVVDADEGGLFEIAEGVQLAEDERVGPVEAVGLEGFDDDIFAGGLVAAGEGDAERPRADDAARLVARQRERLEGGGVEGDGLPQGGEGVVPVAAFEGRAVDVVVRLGARTRIADEAGDLREVALARVEVADDDLELGEAVPQRGEFAPGVFGEAAEAGDEFLDRLALGVVAQGEAVARADGAGGEAVPTLEAGDGLVEVEVGLAGFLLFGLDVQHEGSSGGGSAVGGALRFASRLNDGRTLLDLRRIILLSIVSKPRARSL